MPRSRLQELLQNHRFWLLDVVPSGTFPYFVLGAPIFGFQSVSSPEYTFETREVKEVNSMYKRTVYEGGSMSPVSLSRGVRVYDDTFYEWARRAQVGIDNISRDLLLIHFSGIVGEPGQIDIPAPTSGGEFMLTLPGKAWLLWGCVPIRYKAASDFDASSADISLMELDIQPWAMSEFTIMSPL